MDRSVEVELKGLMMLTNLCVKDATIQDNGIISGRQNPVNTIGVCFV